MPPPRPAGTGRTAHGFTLLELAIAMAIAVVLTAMALPSFSDLMARQRLKAAAETLRADVALARREAGSRARTVHLVFRPGSQWCYAVSTDPAADCNAGAGAPPAPGLIRLVRGTDQPGVLLLAARAMALDGRTGGSQTTDGSAQFAIASGQQLLVRVGALGHASVCASGLAIGGIPPCPPASPSP